MENMSCWKKKKKEKEENKEVDFITQGVAKGFVN